MAPRRLLKDVCCKQVPPFLISLRLGSFRAGDARNKAETLLRLIDVLAESGYQAIREGQNIPPLYHSGIYYKTCVPLNSCQWDTWKDAVEVARDGHGDCKDLVAYRIAELRARGIAARPLAEIDMNSAGIPLYHFTLVRADGTKEDPSVLLGMKG